MRRAWIWMVALGSLVAGAGPARAQAPPPVVAVGDPAVDGGRLPRGRLEKRMTLLEGGEARDMGSLVQILEPGPRPGTLLSVQTFDSPHGTTVDSALAALPSLAPIAHRSHNAARTMALDFDGRRVRGIVDPDSGATEVLDDTLEAAPFDSNVVDLVVAALPLAEGYRARLPFFVHEEGGLVWYEVESVQAARLEDGRGAWKVALDANGRALTYWIDRDSRAVLRSEYELGEDRTFRIETRSLSTRSSRTP